MVGRRKAYGRYGARWRVTVGAVDGDPTKFTARYRATFERHGRSFVDPFYFPDIIKFFNQTCLTICIPIVGTVIF